MRWSTAFRSRERRYGDEGRRWNESRGSLVHCLPDREVPAGRLFFTPLDGVLCNPADWDVVRGRVHQLREDHPEFTPEVSRMLAETLRAKYKP
jgi:hypothetical protein